MRRKIWKTALSMIDSKKVVYKGISKHSLWFEVGQQSVEIRQNTYGTQIYCTCENGSLKPHTLCCHKLAVINHYMKYIEKIMKDGI